MDIDPSINDWLVRIEQACTEGESELAMSLAEAARLETNNHPAVLEIAGVAYYRAGHLDEAIDLLEAAMFEICLSFSSQLLLAKAWLRKGNRESAETTAVFLVEMLDRVPCSLLPKLTHVLSELELFELALQVCRTSFARHPDDDNAIFGAAFYMFRCGYPLELVKGVVAHALSLNPNSCVYRVNMAAVCCGLCHWQEAYDNACQLPDRAISSVPCQCVAGQLRELFQRFDDTHRLNLLPELK